MKSLLQSKSKIHFNNELDNFNSKILVPVEVKFNRILITCLR